MAVQQQIQVVATSTGPPEQTRDQRGSGERRWSMIRQTSFAVDLAITPQCGWGRNTPSLLTWRTHRVANLACCAQLVTRQPSLTNGGWESVIIGDLRNYRWARVGTQRLVAPRKRESSSRRLVPASIDPDQLVGNGPIGALVGVLGWSRVTCLSRRRNGIVLEAARSNRGRQTKRCMPSIWPAPAFCWIIGIRTSQ